MSAIHFAGVRKRFGTHQVLNGLDLSVESGEVYALLGPNGCGKSTAINILCGLLSPDAGQVQVAGAAVGGPQLAALGVCPQEIALYRDLTPAENFDFFARLYGKPAGGRRREVAALLAELGLQTSAATRVGELSGGLQRRVNIGVALVNEPRILVLDEPTAGLDVEARQELWQVLDALRGRGMTILLTTHHLDEAERLASHVGILQSGRIARTGTVAELLSLVPARSIALVETDDEHELVERARALGWGVRRYGGRVGCLLPNVPALTEVADQLRGIPIRSLALQPVSLEHAYLEVVGGAAYAPQANRQAAAGLATSRKGEKPEVTV